MQGFALGWLLVVHGAFCKGIQFFQNPPWRVEERDLVQEDLVSQSGRQPSDSASEMSVLFRRWMGWAKGMGDRPSSTVAPAKKKVTLLKLELQGAQNTQSVEATCKCVFISFSKQPTPPSSMPALS